MIWAVILDEPNKINDHRFQVGIVPICSSHDRTSVVIDHSIGMWGYPQDYVMPCETPRRAAARIFASVFGGSCRVNNAPFHVEGMTDWYAVYYFNGISAGGVAGCIRELSVDVLEEDELCSPRCKALCNECLTQGLIEMCN